METKRKSETGRMPGPLRCVTPSAMCAWPMDREGVRYSLLHGVEQAEQAPAVGTPSWRPGGRLFRPISSI